MLSSIPTPNALHLFCYARRNTPKSPSRSLHESKPSPYARLLETIAPLVLVTNGAQTQVFHSLSKARLPELPQRSELDRDILKFVLSDEQREALRREAKHELFIIDDVKTFKGILRSCHNEIRNNEGMDRTAAFDEMSKVMFCKLYEEKENPKGIGSASRSTTTALNG